MITVTTGDANATAKVTSVVGEGQSISATVPGTFKATNGSGTLTWVTDLGAENPSDGTDNDWSSGYTLGNALDGVKYIYIPNDYNLFSVYDSENPSGGTLDAEYNNGSLINVTGNGSDFFKREVTVNGVRIMGAGTVGGQTAVPDAWLEKVARMVELFTDVNGAGINETSQRNLIKTLSGDAGTYHAGFPTIQRVARG